MAELDVIFKRDVISAATDSQWCHRAVRQTHDPTETKSATVAARSAGYRAEENKFVCCHECSHHEMRCCEASHNDELVWNSTFKLAFEEILLNMPVKITYSKYRERLGWRQGRQHKAGIDY